MLGTVLVGASVNGLVGAIQILIQLDAGNHRTVGWSSSGL